MPKVTSLILTSLLALILIIAGCSEAVAGPAVGKVTGYISKPIKPQIGMPAPDFTFKTADGRESSLSQLRGSVVFINFWATTCIYCVEEMPYLQQAYDEWRDKGVSFLAIDLSEKDATVRSFLQRNNYSLPVLIDDESGTASQYNVYFIPATFIIDRNGIIKFIKTGPFKNKEQISESIRSVYPQ